MLNHMRNLILFCLLATSFYAQPNNGPFPITGGSGSSSAVNAPEAVSFIKNNGITSLSAQNALIWAENDLKNNNFWTNLVDLIPFYSVYNPSNGYTMMGHQYTNKDFTVGSFGLSYTPSGINLNVPPMTNGTMAILWSFPIQMDGGQAGTAGLGWGSLLGLYGYNGTSSNELVYADSDIYPETVFSITNGVESNLHSSFYNWIYQYASSAYLNDNAGPNPLSNGGANNANHLQQRLDIISFNTNGNITYFRNGIMGKTAAGGSVFTNNVNGYYTAPFTNFFVGPPYQPNPTIDYKSLYSTLTNNVAQVFLFNTECSSNMALAIARASRILDPRRNTAVLLGDSLFAANFTNCIESIMISSPAWNDWYVYNLGQSGQSATTIDGANAQKGLYPFLNNISGLPNINRTKVFYNFGINDFGLLGESPFTLWNAATDVCLNALMPKTPDFGVEVGTLGIVSITNMVLYASPALVNANVLTYNTLLVSNSWFFRDGVYDKGSLFSLYTQETNVAGPGISLDGLHANGYNGIYFQQQIAGVMSGLGPNVNGNVNTYGTITAGAGLNGTGYGITHIQSSNVDGLVSANSIGGISNVTSTVNWTNAGSFNQGGAFTNWGLMVHNNNEIWSIPAIVSGKWQGGPASQYVLTVSVSSVSACSVQCIWSNYSSIMYSNFYYFVANSTNTITSPVMSPNSAFCITNINAVIVPNSAVISPL